MARALGYNASLIFAYESSEGVAEATGEYWKLPFVSCDLGAEQGLLDDEVLGLGRDPQAPTYDLKRVGGTIVVPLDINNIGFWLKLVYGAPSTTGAGPYTHVFTSGGTSPVTACIEIGYPNVPAYFMNTGIKGDSIQFGVTRTGKPIATIQVIGQDEAKDTSATDATPNELAYTRFNAFEGSIKRNGTALSNVVSADMTYSNQLEAVETLRADALIEGVDLGMGKLNGSITSRFAATTLYDDAVAATALDILLLFDNATQSLTIEAQSALLPVAKRPVSGPGGVEVTQNFQGALDSGEGEMMEVTLVNSTATYVNAT